MKVYGIKTLLLHLAITCAYVAATSYFFVIAHDPNPVGTGIRQWFCIFLHLTITLFTRLSYVGKATDKREATVKLSLHLAAILFAVSTLLLISFPLSEWLWSQR